MEAQPYDRTCAAQLKVAPQRGKVRELGWVGGAEKAVGLPRTLSTLTPRGWVVLLAPALVVVDR